MYALLDNSQAEEIQIFASTAKGAWKRESFSRATNDVLGALQALLINAGCTLKDLQGLAVVVGQGRFTATRIATVVANTLAFAQNIAVIAVPAPDTELAWALLQTATKGQFIIPSYSAEAHIGGKPQAAPVESETQN